jgi:hypothetical protein
LGLLALAGAVACTSVLAANPVAASASTAVAATATFEQPVSFDPLRPVFKGTPAGQARASLSADGKTLEVAAGDYRTRFEARPSWTMRSVFYKTANINQSEGGAFLQCVLNEKHGQVDASGKKVDPFIVSGHRPEQIDQLVVELYAGTQRLSREAVTAGLKPQVGGDTVVVRKKSRFVSAYNGLLMSLDYTTVITPAGVEQYARLTPGDGDITKINFFYPVMQMYPNATQNWAAFLGAKVVEAGVFKDDNSFSLGKQVTAFVTFDPETKTGIYFYHPAEYAGGVNNIWHRSGDNKVYFRYPRFKSVEDVRDYRLFLTAFPCTGLASEQPAEGAGWKAVDFPSGGERARFWIKE